MKKKSMVVGSVLLLVVVGIVLLVFVLNDGKQPASDLNRDNGKTARDARPVTTGSSARQNPAKKVRRPIPRIVFDDPDYPYSAEDKRVASELQDALDNCTADTEEDGSDGSDGIFSAKLSSAHKKLMKAASAAASSDNPSVRLRAVEAYSWIGKDALPEVTSMMADPNENVSEQAIEAAEQALVDIDDPKSRFELATAYMSTFSSNEDALSMLGGISSSAALGIVEPASDSPADVAAALEDRQFFVETVNALVEGGQGKCGEHAQTLYEDVTGSQWIDATEGARWAQDPDGYEPPEALESPEALDPAEALEAPEVPEAPAAPIEPIG